MADNSFLDFNVKTPVSADYFVGFAADASTEYKAQIQQLLTLASSHVLANTLTTSVCAISGNGVTPFVMNFTNGLLTSITV